MTNFVLNKLYSVAYVLLEATPWHDSIYFQLTYMHKIVKNCFLQINDSVKHLLLVKIPSSICHARIFCLCSWEKKFFEEYLGILNEFFKSENIIQIFEKEEIFGVINFIIDN